jgi:hypothetical protein
MKLPLDAEEVVIAALRTHPEVERVEISNGEVWAWLKDAKGGAAVIAVDYHWPNGLPWEDS